MSQRINYNQFRESLKEAARRAFDQVRRRSPNELFYVYALHTCDDASYIIPSANSEEGLKRKIAEYGRTPGFSSEDIARELRWNACEWVYHGTGEQHFTDLQHFLEHALTSDAITDVTYQRRVKRLFSVFVQCLRDLDAEGFFGSGEERDRITLLLTMGDIDEGPLLEWAQQLNPPPVFQRFRDSFSTQTGRYTESGSRKYDAMRSVSTSRDKSLLAVGGWDHVLVFATSGFQEIFKKRVSRNESAGVCACALSPDGERLYVGMHAGDRTGRIQCWSVQKRNKCGPETALPTIVRTLAISPDGQLLAAGCDEDPRIRIWNSGTMEVAQELSGHTTEVRCIRYSPDGSMLASVEHAPSSLRVWDAKTGKLIARLDDSGNALAFSPDGTRLAVVSGMADDRVGARVWSVAKRRRVRDFSGGPGSLSTSCVAFSANGRLLACGGSFAGVVQLWDIASGKEAGRLTPDYDQIADMVFVDNGKTMAVVGKGLGRRLPLLLWDVAACG